MENGTKKVNGQVSITASNSKKAKSSVKKRYDKKKFDAFNIFYNRLMQDDNHLTKIEKEMIVVVVSSTNRCLYCCISHGYTLGKLMKSMLVAILAIGMIM